MGGAASTIRKGLSKRKTRDNDTSNDFKVKGISSPDPLANLDPSSFRDPAHTTEITYTLPEKCMLRRISGLMKDESPFLTFLNSDDKANTESDISDEAVRKMLLHQHLRMQLDATIFKLAAVVPDHEIKERSIYIAHAWPGTEEEEDLMASIVSVIDILNMAGLHPTTAMTAWRDENVSFQLFIKKHLQHCSDVLYIMSPSFQTEYNRVESNLYYTASTLASLNRDAAPVILSGSFSTSVPESLSHVLAANLSSPELYCKGMAELIARLLQVEHQPKAKQVLSDHEKAVDVVMNSISTAELNPDDISRISLSYKEEKQRLKLRTFVLQSNLTRKQRRYLDNGLYHRMNTIGQLAQKRMASTISSMDVKLLSDIQTTTQCSLTQKYNSFMTSSKATLLVMGDQDMINAAEQLLVSLQWRYFSAKHKMIPIVIDLASIRNPALRIVEQALSLYQYTNEETEALRDGHPGLVLFFKNWNRHHHCTNLYVQNNLEGWGSLYGHAPKVVFLVNIEEARDALYSISHEERHKAKSAVLAGTKESQDGDTQARYWKLPPVLHPRLLGADFEGPIVLYFLPCDSAHQPMPEAFETITLTTSYNQPPTLFEGEDFVEAAAVGNIVSSKPQPNVKGNNPQQQSRIIDIEKLKRRCSIALHQKYIESREKLVRKLLKKDLIHLHSVFADVVNLSPDKRLKGFISYSWPRSLQEREALQKRLTYLRSDMRSIGVDVILDILDLKPGMDIDKFMKENVVKSSAVFLIGTQGYHKRVPEPINTITEAAVDNADVTNVGKEYCFIREEANSRGLVVFPLWFCQGNSVTTIYSFPTGIFQYPFETVNNCTTYVNYFRSLPHIYTRILKVFQSDIDTAKLAEWNKVCKELGRLNCIDIWL